MHEIQLENLLIIYVQSVIKPLRKFQSVFQWVTKQSNAHIQLFAHRAAMAVDVQYKQPGILTRKYVKQTRCLVKDILFYKHEIGRDLSNDKPDLRYKKKCYLNIFAMWTSLARLAFIVLSWCYLINNFHSQLITTLMIRVTYRSHWARVADSHQDDQITTI